MLPEEDELVRLEGEQAELEEQVASAELMLESTRADINRFQHRYYRTVGRLYAQLDELDAKIARAMAAQSPKNTAAQARAQSAQDRARRSSEELSLIEALPPPRGGATAQLKQAYRRAAKLMHPDRATTESERLRRTALMAEVNRAYEMGDLKTIEKLILKFGQDPESITGDDTASRIVRAIRRIAQLLRRLGEVKEHLDVMREAEIFRLKTTIEEDEATGGNPLGDLAKQLKQKIAQRMGESEVTRSQ
jgi:hypothetical protein